MHTSAKYIFYLLLLSVGLSAQGFDSMGNQWIQTGENLVGYRFPFYVELSEDTLINDLLYRSAYIQDSEFISTPQYIGAIRQENNLVFVVLFENEALQEFLIYDWSALIGDTISQKEF